MKVKLLNYLLLQKQGEIFNKLLNRLEHHSLAQLMIELLELKITLSKDVEKFNLDWDKDERNQEEEKEEIEMTPTE